MIFNSGVGVLGRGLRHGTQITAVVLRKPDQLLELLNACAEAIPLQIELTDLVSADAAGIEALQRLRGQGASLVGAPGYLQMKLDSPSDRP